MTEPAPPIDYLTLEDLLEIAAGVVDGVLVEDMGLLASAAARPQMSVFGEDAYRHSQRSWADTWSDSNP